MADIYTNKQDEETIKQVRLHGLKTPNAPKLRVLRIACARSLQLATPPGKEYDRIDSNLKGSEYERARITGKGLQADESGRQNFDHAIRTLLCVYHEEDLFNGVKGEKRFNQLLQRHVRRGLHEIRTTWRPGHDFHQFLYHELFGTVTPAKPYSDRSQVLLSGLKEIGISARINDVKEGPRISRYRIYLNDLNHLERMRRGLDKLELHLGLQKQGIFLSEDSEPRVVALDIPRPRETWQTIPGTRIREWTDGQKASAAKLTVWSGVNVLGEPFSFNLAECPHLLIAGTTGSGKSVCLHALILSLLWSFGPEQLQLCLIDPKKMEFVHYAGLPHLVDGKIIDEIEGAQDQLDWVVEEMESRTLLLQKAGVSGLIEAREQGLLNLPYLLIIVEELADLIYQSREIEEPLVRLAQKARATGIHLVLATQRPDAATFSGLLRSNIPARIALSVQKSSESKIILDEIGAEKLSGRGDMLVKPFAGAPSVRIHGTNVIKDDIINCVQAARRKYS